MRVVVPQDTATQIVRLKFQVHFERKPLGRLEMDEDTSAVF